MATASFYAWRRKYNGTEVGEAKRLKNLEDENRRLKQMVADEALDIQMLKAVNGKRWKRPAERRKAVRWLQVAFDISERRACRTKSESEKKPGAKARSVQRESLTIET